MTTIKDIAREAQVSIATVSMALHGKKCISQKTKKRILSIAKELNYVPNTTARALKTKKTHTIGLVVGNLGNSYFTDIIAAAVETAHKSGYNIFICDAALSLENAVSCLQALHARNVDGILFSLSINVNNALIEELDFLLSHNIHVVSLTPSIDNPKIPIVSFADATQVETLINRLIDSGHRNIAAIGGPHGSWMNNGRLKACCNVLKAQGVYNESYIAYSNLTIQDGQAAARHMLTQHPEITAIYCINDLVAAGTLKAAQELGLAVPQQLSLVGSDGVDLVTLTTPNISTVVTPRRTMGQMAAEILIELIEGKDPEENLRTFIPCSIFEGNSMSKARQ